jgi:hypothetical protein
VLRVLSADGLLASDRAQQQTVDLSLTYMLALLTFDSLAHVGIGTNACAKTKQVCKLAVVESVLRSQQWLLVRFTS